MRADRSLLVFQDLQERGLEVNIVTWCSLVRGLAHQAGRGSPHLGRVAYELWDQLYSSSACVQRFRAPNFMAGEDKKAPHILFQVVCSLCPEHVYRQVQKAKLTRSGDLFGRNVGR